MEKRLITGICPVICAFSLSACSIETEPCNNVSQDSIHQHYNVSYSATDTTHLIQATFRFGGITGTTLELVGSCSVTHNSTALTAGALSGLLGTSYSRSISGYTEDHTLVFTNADGTTYTTSFSYLGTIDFDSPPSTISKAAGATIDFKGGALQTDESAILTFSDSSNTLYTKTQDTVGAESVTISADDFASGLSSTGTLNMQIERYRKVELSEKTSTGGFIDTRYKTAKQSVEVTD